MTDSDYRHRLVVLGANRVGKTSIIKRFLGQGFQEKYRETVEDLYCKEYRVDGVTVRVDILDTAGNDEFPAMRRLSLTTGHAFILIYSVESAASFQAAVAIYEQLKDQRSDLASLPLIVAANKTDLCADRDVEDDEIQAWLRREDISVRQFVQCSAKDGRNILDIFYRLLEQYKNPQVRMLSPVLRRKMSAYAATRRRNRGNNTQDVVKEEDNAAGADQQQGKKGSLKVPTGKAMEEKRSRSLIRRISQKAQGHRAFQKESADIKDDDCCIS